MRFENTTCIHIFDIQSIKKRSNRLCIKDHLMWIILHLYPCDYISNYVSNLEKKSK